MTEGEPPPDRRRRRRAAAALTDLRERLTGACGKFAKVEDWRGFLAQHFTPLLNEFGDVLPAGARGLLEGAADVAEPTQAGIAKACEMLRGGLKSVAEEMAARTGLQQRIQDAIQQAFRPVAALVPDAIAKTTLGKALVALALAAVGAGSIAGVAAVVMSGGGGGLAQPSVLGVSANPTATADSTANLPTGTATPGAPGGSLPDPCTLVTKADAEAAFGEPPAEIETDSFPIGSSGGFCSYWTSEGPDCRSMDIRTGENNDSLLDYPESFHDGQPVTGIGDEAYVGILDAAFVGTQVVVRQGEFSLFVSARLSPQCVNVDDSQWRDEVTALAVLGLSRLGN